MKKISLRQFWEIRKNLTQEKLIEETVWDRKMEKEDIYDLMTTIAYSCALYNEYTGNVELSAKTKAASPLGGTMITSPSGQELVSNL